MDNGLGIPIVAGRESEFRKSIHEKVHPNEKAGFINEVYVSEEDVEVVVVGEDGDVIREPGMITTSAEFGVLFAIEKHGFDFNK